MQHSQDFDPIVANSIERKIFPDNKVANTRQDVVPRRTRSGMEGQQVLSTLKSFHKTDCGGWIVSGDVIADNIEVD